MLDAGYWMSDGGWWLLDGGWWLKGILVHAGAWSSIQQAAAGIYTRSAPREHPRAICNADRDLECGDMSPL
jgi:hypothetical protein